MIAPPHPKTWSAAIASLAHELTLLEGTACRGLVVRIETRQDGSATLLVESDDGRRASRPVGEPNALVPIALGVLASLPEQPGPNAEGPVADESVERSDDDDRERSSPSVAPTTRDKPARGDGSFDLAQASKLAAALSTGTRIGLPVGILMVDVEARLEASITERTFLVAHGRFVPIGAPLGSTLDEDNYREYAAGAGIGRYFPAGRSIWKLSFEPEVTLVSMESDELVGGDRSGTKSQVRLLGTLGWSSAPVGPLRFVALFDGGVAPYSLGHVTRAAEGLAQLPAWMLGLRLGASFESR